MAAYWNLKCIECSAEDYNVQCSMYSIPLCNCGGERRLMPSSGIRKSGIFPFTVPHVNGKPMEIRDMVHLRQVEKNYGVAFSAFSKSNINDLDGMADVPKYRGDEYERHR